EGRNVSLQNPVPLSSIHRLVQGENSVMGTAPGPKSIRALQEILLVDGPEHLGQCSLDDFVLDRRDSNWPGLAVPARGWVPRSLRSRPHPCSGLLWDVHSLDRLMTVSLRLHPFVQVPEILFQGLPVLLFARAIDTHRRILAQSVVRSFERWH